MEATRSWKQQLTLQRDRGSWLRPLALLGLIIVMYAAVVPRLVLHWWNDPNYSHGLLVVPLAAYLVWIQRKVILAAAATPGSRGLAITLMGCGTYVVGVLGAELFLSRLSLAIVLAGVVWTFWGKERLVQLAFPFLLVLSVIPLPAIVYNQLAAPLQLFASWVSAAALQAVGVPIYQDGNVLHLAGVSLGVEEACSGLRSMSSLAILALLIGHFREAGLGTCLLLLVLSVPVAVAANVLRVAGTALLVEFGDLSLAMGFYHTFAGWLVFVAGLVMLCAIATIHHWMRRKPERGA